MKQSKFTNFCTEIDKKAFQSNNKSNLNSNTFNFRTGSFKFQQKQNSYSSSQDYNNSQSTCSETDSQFSHQDIEWNYYLPQNLSVSKNNQFEIFEKDKLKDDDQLYEILEELQEEVNLVLQEDAEQQKYQRTIDWDLKKDINHWGQRKLLMTEIWFLNQYKDLAQTIVYVGAAPGCHIPLLAKLFPQHYFILVDPADFTLRDDILEKDDLDQRIQIINQYFTDKLAEELKQKYKNILFLCDIRTADINFKPPQDENISQQEIDLMKKDHFENVEKMVKLDHEWQKNWCQIMQPKKSLLKFRCPYPCRDQGKLPFYYFKGQILLQPYVGCTSTETRLIPDNYDQLIQYDNVKYEEQLYYHNHSVRQNNVIKSQSVLGEGLKKQWDYAAEILILGEFLIQNRDFMLDNYSFEASISKLSYDISRQCSKSNSKRTLSSRNIPQCQRNKNFRELDHVSFQKKIILEKNKEKQQD